MKQFLSVLKFELGNYFKNKSFMVTTIIIALLAIGLVAVPTMIPGLLDDLSPDTSQTASMSDSASEASGDAQDRADEDTYGLCDTQGILSKEVLASFAPNARWQSFDSKEDLNKAVDSGEVECGFLLDSPTSYTYVVQNNEMYDQKQSMFEELMTANYQITYLTEKGLTQEEIQEFRQSSITSTTEILGKDSARNYWYTYILIFVLYFLILFYGQMIAVSVTTEKSNRAIEILVTSVNPTSLIFGKVIAGAISGVIQIGIILGSAFGTYSVFREDWGYALDFLFHVPGAVWAIYATFGLLGYLLYAFIYGTLGALVSKTEDISKSSTFITLLYVVSFLVSIMGMNASDSTLVKVASYIPFTSSNAMLVRVAMGSVAFWEVAVSFLILLVSCGVIGILAAKIFRFGTLMYGNPIKFTTALKKIRQQN